MTDDSEQKTMLIIDDSYADRILLNEIFYDDYTIVETDDEKEALIKIRDSVFSVVILNIISAKINGYNILREIQKNSFLSETPVVALTSLDDVSCEIKALDLGAAEVITKPFNSRIIKSRIKNMVGRSESLRITEQNRYYESRLQRQENLIRYTEYHEKSGIYNKETFYRKVSEMISENSREKYAIVRCDIDRFKLLNDIFGMQTGDKFLSYAGSFCRRKKKEHTIFGHIEADHFVFCLPQKDLDTDLLMKYAFDFFDSLNMDFSFVPRFGIYPIEDPSLDINLMCDRALLALRSIKSDFSRHYAFYEDSLRGALLEEQEIINEMASAMEDGEFYIHLQPQYNHTTGAIVGAEALARWHHPTKGILFPQKFIPVFEKNGLIARLDEYIWDKACALLSKWKKEGRKIVPVSVNLSRIDMCIPDLFEKLCAMTEKYDISPKMLRLEITESAYMDNPTQLISQVTRLRDHGFIIEIDDFGSGYSSLNTLKDVPVDILKLDMRFLSSNGAGIRSGIILNSIIRMARWLDLEVIAEGVETTSQAEYLRTLGCELIQGHLYSKPLTISDFEKLADQTPVSDLDLSENNASLSEKENFFDLKYKNSFVSGENSGAACILEYRPTDLATINVNDKYLEMLGMTSDNFRNHSYQITETIVPEDRELLINMTEEAIRTEKVSKNLIHCRISGKIRTFIIKCKIVGKNYDRFAVYASIEDPAEG